MIRDGERTHLVDHHVQFQVVSRFSFALWRREQAARVRRVANHVAIHRFRLDRGDEIGNDAFTRIEARLTDSVRVTESGTRAPRVPRGFNTLSHTERDDSQRGERDDDDISRPPLHRSVVSEDARRSQQPIALVGRRLHGSHGRGRVSRSRLGAPNAGWMWGGGRARRRVMTRRVGMNGGDDHNARSSAGRLARARVERPLVCPHRAAGASAARRVRRRVNSRARDRRRAATTTTTTTVGRSVGCARARRVRTMMSMTSSRRRDLARVSVGVVFAFVSVVFAFVSVVVAQEGDGEDTCVASGQIGIFVQYSENAGNAVFQSEDNACLAGGGRGVGCCPGSICDVTTCKVPCKDAAGESVECDAVGATEDVDAGFFQCPCAPCPTGTVQALSSKHECVECPAGWYNSKQGQATCTPCPVGTFSSRVGNPTGCTPCPVGTSGRSTLEEYYAKTTRAFRAPASGPGSVFDPTIGATSCTDCPAGTSGGGAGEACVPCAPGTYSDKRAETCTPCPVGTYGVESGGSSIDACIPCAAGESNDAPGSTSCWQVCPNALLSCAESEVREAGYYASLEVDRPRVRYAVDTTDDYRAKICRLGCETYGTDHWCPSYGDLIANDCVALSPPSPPSAPPPPPAPPPAPPSPPPSPPPAPPPNVA